jgi:hypothetical protein
MKKKAYSAKMSRRWQFNFLKIFFESGKQNFCGHEKDNNGQPASHAHNFYACIISGKPEGGRKHHTQRSGGREKGGTRMVVV